MRALLDTNIIIHRENTRVTSRTIGQLFYWLDKLHYEKLLHGCNITDILDCSFGTGNLTFELCDKNTVPLCQYMAQWDCAVKIVRFIS